MSARLLGVLVSVVGCCWSLPGALVCYAGPSPRTKVWLWYWWALGVWAIHKNWITKLLLSPVVALPFYAVVHLSFWDDCPKNRVVLPQGQEPVGLSAGVLRAPWLYSKHTESSPSSSSELQSYREAHSWLIMPSPQVQLQIEFHDYHFLHIYDLLESISLLIVHEGVSEHRGLCLPNHHHSLRPRVLVFIQSRSVQWLNTSYAPDWTFGQQPGALCGLVTINLERKENHQEKNTPELTYSQAYTPVSIHSQHSGTEYRFSQA